MKRMTGASTIVMALLMLHGPEAAAQKKKKKKTADNAGVVSPIGRPKFDAGGPPRIAIWHDGEVSRTSA